MNTRQGSRRLLEFAFEHAIATGRKKVTIVHKANIMKALTGIFLETGKELYERKYKGRFALDTVIIDACAMKLVLNPWQFDVLVTTNLFGDILSDLVAGLVGGLGMTPGANIGADAAIFEAVHGSAPDIAGKGVANPTALLLAAAMMLDHCKLPRMAARLRTAIDQTLNADGVRTGDLGGNGEHGASSPRRLVKRIAQCLTDATSRRLSSPCRRSSRSRTSVKSYASGVRALKPINLEIDKGEIFALLGPNGAGKTTLINIICGIVTASGGRVTADGHDIVRDYRAARTKIGLVPQELTTDSFETVWATVTFSRGLFGRAPNPAYRQRACCAICR